jgi:N4-gp56 family major capsid protein
MATMNTTNLSIELKEFYEKALLDRLIDQVQLYNFAKKTVLPRNVGSTISWRIFKSLALPTVALQEGVPPVETNLSIVNYQTAITQHGAFVKLTDFVEMVGIDPILTETSQLLGEQAAEYIDKLIRTPLYAGLQVRYGGGAADRAAVAAGTVAAQGIQFLDLNEMVKTFKRNNVKPFAEGKYLLLITPEVEMDLKNLTGANTSWIDISKYNNTEMIMKGEIGSLLGFKIIVDNNLEQASTSVHLCLAMGADAFGVVEIAGGSGKPSIIYKGLGSAGVADPLDQIQTLGWKLPGFTTRIIYEEALIRYEVKSGVPAAALVDASREHYVSANNN